MPLGGRYRRAQLEESRDAAKYAIFTKKNYLTSHVNRASVNKLCSEGPILGKEAAHFPQRQRDKKTGKDGGKIISPLSPKKTKQHWIITNKTASISKSKKI